MNKYTLIRTVLSLGLSLLGPVAGAQTCNPALSPTAPDSRFEVVAGSNGAEIRDTRTQLVWQRCPIGQSWNGSTCTGTPTQMTWVEALKQAHAYTSNISWRLANIKELQSLVEEQCMDLALNQRIFPVPATLGALWSSTPVAGAFSSDGVNTELGAWTLDAATGVTGRRVMSSTQAGWAVRSRN